MGTITTSICTDAQLKREADRLFADLGMNFSTAVNIFLRQAVRKQGQDLVVKSGYARL